MQLRYSVTSAMLVDVNRLRKSFWRDVLRSWAGTTGAIVAYQVFSGLLPRLLMPGNINLKLLGFFLAIWIVPGLVFGIAYAAYARYIHYSSYIRRFYRENKSFYQNILLLADDNGMEWTTAHSTTKFRWEELQSFKRTTKYLIVSVSRSLYYTVPKQEIGAYDALILTDLLEKNLKCV